jgi:hypothetical protein
VQAAFVVLALGRRTTKSLTCFEKVSRVPCFSWSSQAEDLRPDRISHGGAQRTFLLPARLASRERRDNRSSSLIRLQHSSTRRHHSLNKPAIAHSTTSGLLSLAHNDMCGTLPNKTSRPNATALPL